MTRFYIQPAVLELGEYDARFAALKISAPSINSKRVRDAARDYARELRNEGLWADTGSDDDERAESWTMLIGTGRETIETIEMTELLRENFEHEQDERRAAFNEELKAERRAKWIEFVRENPDAARRDWEGADRG